jgi:translocation and assembly module TamB
VARATGGLEGANGHLWARLAVSGRAPELRLSGEVLGKGVEMPPLRPGDFSGRFALAGDTLTVQDLVFPVAPGQIKVSGTMRLAPNLPVKLRAELESASLARVLDRTGGPESWVDFAVSGQVTVQGKLSPAPQLSGEAALHAADFRFTAGPVLKPPPGPPLLAFPGGDIKLELAVLPDRVELRGAEIRAGDARARADARFGFQKAVGLSITGVVDPLDLHAVGPLIGIPWAGVGSARFSLGLPWGELVHIDADVALRDAEFRHFALGAVKTPLRFASGVLSFPEVTGTRGRSPFSGAATLDFRGEALTVEMRARMPEGRVDDLVEVVAPLSPVWQPLRRVLTGSASAAVHVWGPADVLAADIDIAAQGVAYRERRVGNGEVRLRLRGETLELLPLVFRGPLGTSQAEGRMATTAGDLDYRFRIDGMSLEELLGPEWRRAQARGALVLAGTVRGTSDVPDVHGTLTAPQITLGGRSLGPMNLEGRMLGEQLEIWGRPIAEAEGRFTAEVRRPYPFRATLGVGISDLHPLLGESWQGSLSGKLTAAGTLLEPEGTEGKVHLDRLRIQRGEARAENDGPWDVRFAGGRVETDGLTLRGPETSLDVSGSVSSRALDLKVAGRVDLRLAEPLAPALERLRGRLELSGTAQGSLREPALLGTANLLDVSFSPRGSSVELRGLAGRIDFSETRMLWTDVRGQLNDGQFSSRGDLAWKGFAPTQIAASARLEDVTLRILEDAPFSATGELVLSGKPGALRLSGELDVARLRYVRPFGVGALLPGRAKGGAVEGERPQEWLALDVLLHFQDARVENNVARAQLTGDLRVTGTNLQPGLVGTVEAGEGSQAFFRGNAFAITQGVADFKDRRSLQGVFDVYAETQVRDYQIRLHAFGRLDSPQIQLSSDPSLPEGDVLSLLTLGVTGRERAGMSGTAGAGATLAAEALYQASGLDQQVQRFLPQNTVLRDTAFRIATQYNDFSGLVEPSAQLESKFLVEQLKLSLSQPVSGKGTRAQAEYRFDNRLSAQAQWDNAYSDIPIGNLGIDLKLRWEVE